MHVAFSFRPILWLPFLLRNSLRILGILEISRQVGQPGLVNQPGNEIRVEEFPDCIVRQDGLAERVRNLPIRAPPLGNSLQSLKTNTVNRETR